MGFYQLRKQLPEALLASLYFFLVLFAYYLLKPLRDSSFLSEFHPHAKPLFNVVTMTLLFFAAGFYNQIVKAVRGRLFLVTFYLGLILNLLLFRMLFAYAPALAGGVFYAWLSLANVFLVTVFWTQMNGSFTNFHDKLLYVVVGLGGVAGAACGGKLTEMIVPKIGSDNLIYVACALLVLALGAALLMARRVAKKQLFQIPEVDHERANFRGLLQDRYAVAIFALVAIGTFVHQIYDYQLSVLVANTVEKTKDSYAVFYGDLYFKMNFFSFLAQCLIGPLVLFSIGPARGLYIFFFLIIGTAGALLFNNSLAVMEWAFIIFVGSGYSIVQIFREQLYVPASQFIKVSCKGFIDTFGFRVGDSVAAIAFVVLVSWLNWDAARLDYLVIAAAFVAAYYLFEANRMYRELLSAKESRRE